MASGLPPQHRALVLETFDKGLQLRTVPNPQLDSGSAIVRVIAVEILSYHREVYNGQYQYPFPKPLIGGCSAIARIEVPGPDAVALQPGQLVFVDCVVRGRDDPSAIFLSAINEGGSEGSKKLMKDTWRDGTFAEFAKVPLENCIPLDEVRLCQDLGYSLQDLMYIGHLLVPYGGLRDIRLEPGETVVICPATGGFGGAGVQVAIAMGARVIALGRNETELKRMKEHVKKGTPGASIETVKVTGDEKLDTAALQAFGTIDAVLDLSPSGARDSTHLKSVIKVLRHGGRCSLMGFNYAFLDMWTIVGNSISMRGKFMYEREDMLHFVKMLERGLFPTGKSFVDTKVFALENWKECFDEASVYTGIGRTVVMAP